MDLHLTCDPAEAVRLHVNGRLVAEIAAGVADTRDTLLADVQQARCLRALPVLLHGLLAELTRCGDLPGHANATPAKRREAYQQGLADGLLQRTVPHPVPGVPPIRPAHSLSYERGYGAGEALARCLAMSEGGSAR